MAKKTINDLGDISGKRVLVRVDFNVPINPKAPTTRDEAVITDDSRIKAAIPTIEALLAKNARVILVSHMGRPDGNVVEGLRLDCVARRLRELIPQTVVKIDDCIGPKLAAAVLQMNSGTVLLLENIRFVAAEESKDEFARTGFAARLADYVDIYVNDAFGTAHRDHASTCSIAKVMNEQGKPCVAGLLMEKELKFLGVALEDPAKPFVVVLGGAKVKDKIPLIENLIGKADKILIGGAMVFGLKDVPLATLFSVDWVLGFFAAGVSSVLVMRWMLSYVRTHSFAIFMWYRIALGLFVVALFFMRG